MSRLARSGVRSELGSWNSLQVESSVSEHLLTTAAPFPIPCASPPCTLPSLCAISYREEPWSRVKRYLRSLPDFHPVKLKALAQLDRAVMLAMDFVPGTRWAWGGGCGVLLVHR